MKLLKLLTSVGIGLSTSLPAVADGQYSVMDDPWRVYLGAFTATVNSEIGINGDLVPPGPPIDVEDILGVEDSKTVAWGGIRWQFARQHSIEAEYFTLNRSDSVSGTFTPPVQVGDLFIENGLISTRYDTSFTRLTYGFSAIRSERANLQLKAGLHIASLDVALQLAGSVCDPTTTPSIPPGCPGASTGSEEEDVSAPLPHFGASYGYALTPTVAFRVAAMGFAIELDSIDGSLIDIGADVAWQPWRNIGFGVGVRYFRGDVESKGSELDGSFLLEYIGPTLYIQATF